MNYLNRKNPFKYYNKVKIALERSSILEKFFLENSFLLCIQLASFLQLEPPYNYLGNSVVPIMFYNAYRRSKQLRDSDA
jgi:hypothetical protein